MNAVIRLDVPDWQIGQFVNVYFPDTMMLEGICEEEEIYDEEEAQEEDQDSST